jgi:hypothetical protein
VAVAIVLATTCIVIPATFYLRWVLIRMPVRRYLVSVARPFFYGAVMGVAVSALAVPLGELAERVQLVLLVGVGIAVYGAVVSAGERALWLRWRES